MLDEINKNSVAYLFTDCFTCTKLENFIEFSKRQPNKLSQLIPRISVLFRLRYKFLDLKQTPNAGKQTVSSNRFQGYVLTAVLVRKIPRIINKKCSNS